MNTQTNFFKSSRSKFGFDKDPNMIPPRVKTSSSPSNNPLSKDYNNNKVKNLIPSIVTNYNIQNLNIMDVEKLRDELIKCKNELNRRNKEFHALKISFIKLDTENKRNSKIIEEVLEEASKQKNINDLKEKNPEEESDVKNILANTFISIGSMNRLKETHIINHMKKQLLDLKILLNSKEEEITMLKTTTKVSRYHELDAKLKNTLEELNSLTDKFNLLKISFNDKDSKLKEMTDERDYYKAMMLRTKSQFEDSKEKLQYYQEHNIKINELNKILEEKNSLSKLQQKSLNHQLKDKESTINELKEEIVNSENYKPEKEKMEKNISALNKSLQTLKDDLEKRNRKIKEIEKINFELKEKNDSLMAENKKISSNLNSASQMNHKEKDKKIRKMEEENLMLKEELKKLNESIKDKMPTETPKETLSGNEKKNMQEESNLNSEPNQTSFKGTSNDFYTSPKEEKEKETPIEKKEDNAEMNIKENERYENVENNEMKGIEELKEKENTVYENTEKEDDAVYDNDFDKVDDDNQLNSQHGNRIDENKTDGSNANDLS